MRLPGRMRALLWWTLGARLKELSPGQTLGMIQICRRFSRIIQPPPQQKVVMRRLRLLRLMVTMIGKLEQLWESYWGGRSGLYFFGAGLIFFTEEQEEAGRP